MGKTKLTGPKHRTIIDTECNNIQTRRSRSIKRKIISPGVENDDKKHRQSSGSGSDRDALHRNPLLSPSRPTTSSVSSLSKTVQMESTGGNSTPSTPITPINDSLNRGVYTPNQHQPSPQYVYTHSQLPSAAVFMPTPSQTPSQLTFQTPTPQTTLTDLDICRVVSSLKESLKDEITAMVRLTIHQEVQPLLSEISQLKSRVHHLESEMDASNQYSRRNCVLISNIEEQTGEDTNTIAINVAKEGGLTIMPGEIDRSHRIGKPGKKKSRDIVVKFVSYQSKAKFMQTRKQLRQNRSKAFINEQLTSLRGELAYQCRLLKKDPNSPITDTWTYDGNIFVKTDPKGPMVRINCHMGTSLNPT